MITIRLATESDSAAIAQLSASVFAATYGAVIPATILQNYLQIHYSSNAILQQLCDSLVSYLGAWQAGRLVGFCKLERSLVHHAVTIAHSIELAKLYVDSDFHGSGVASKLFSIAQIDAAQKGFDGLWLCVWKENPRALAFYRKAGFQVVGSTIIDVDGVAFDDAVMQKGLQNDT